MSSDPSDQNGDDFDTPDRSLNPFAANSTGSTSPADLPSDGERYLHPISLVFSLIGQIKSNLLPALFGVIGAANGNLFYISLAVIFLIPSIAISIIRYFTVRYRISNGELVVNEGLFFRRTRTVPVERIQNIDLVQGVLHRLFKVAEVRVETASGTKPEAVLNVLSLSQVELLRRNVFAQKENASSVVSTSPEVLSPPLDSASVDVSTAMRSPADEISGNCEARTDDLDPTTLLKIPLAWLAKAGLASNRGLIMISVLLGLYLQLDRRQQQDYDLAFLTQWLPDLSNPYFMTVAVIAAGVLGLILLRLLGVGWYILRFFGYQLSLSGEDFKISCGLFTKVSATVPRKRIQFVSIHSNYVSRLLGLSSIRIETAGGASSENENATTTVSRRWFIPVIPSTDVCEMIGKLRPGLKWQPEQYDWQPLAPKAGRRMSRIAISVSLLLMPIGYYFFGVWGCGVTVIALPILVTYASKKSRSIQFARTAFGIVYRSGILTRKTSLTFFEKIQATQIAQTPFDRRWAMATLSVDTAAAGPADHAIEIKYLDADTARREYRAILQASSMR